MSILLRILVCIGGFILLIFVREANIKRKITERQSLFWIGMSLVIIGFGLFPNSVYFIADVFSVNYAPSIIFAIFIMMMTYGIFHTYKVGADLNDKIQELAIQVSLLNEENMKLKKEVHDGKEKSTDYYTGL
ncbi:MAG: DUF2304 domain-containing protein [Peptostreptococcales bacterium]